MIKEKDILIRIDSKLKEQIKLELGNYKSKNWIKTEDFKRAIMTFIAQENSKNINNE